MLAGMNVNSFMLTFALAGASAARTLTGENSPSSAMSPSPAIHRMSSAYDSRVPKSVDELLAEARSPGFDG